MLHTSAVSFTDFLYRHCNLPIGRKSVYVYGAELFFSTSFGTISILLIAVLAGQFISGILFLLVFISLRIFVGGFHASTYGWPAPTSGRYPQPTPRPPVHAAYRRDSSSHLSPRRLAISSGAALHSGPTRLRLPPRLRAGPA